MTTRRCAIRVLSANDVRAALPRAEAIHAMREAFRQLASGDVQMPVRAHINAIGSYQPHVQEIPARTVCRALARAEADDLGTMIRL
jgi:ornithine cyclodeaminase/alanine dehydrogenase-like protein (mu-crystallin family)